eukprot:scaffold631_cov338-Pinguiococcus_pyrenoidosus.AAC.3
MVKTGCCPPVISDLVGSGSQPVIAGAQVPHPSAPASRCPSGEPEFRVCMLHVCVECIALFKHMHLLRRLLLLLLLLRLSQGFHGESQQAGWLETLILPACTAAWAWASSMGSTRKGNLFVEGNKAIVRSENVPEVPILL